MLLVLNGPPAAGKSTLAARFASDRPMALRLDVDELRDLLGRWEDQPEAAGLRARALASAMARNHLASGHDVVVAQLYGRADHLAELEAIAEECGCRFQEVVVMVDIETSRARFTERGGPRFEAVVSSTGGLTVVDELHRRVTELAAARPNARVVDVSSLSLDDAYAAVRAAAAT